MRDFGINSFEEIFYDFLEENEDRIQKCKKTYN